MSEEKENWIDLMIERQAIPEELREGTSEEFCKKLGVKMSTYYYHANKPENNRKIVACAINNAKKHAPEVLENLGIRAKNSTRDAEIYLKFILQLAERTDITSGDKPFPILPLNEILSNKRNREDSETKE